MRKFIKAVIFLLMFGGLLVSKVKAETFIEGSFISGEYINKVSNGKTYYMTMQYITDSEGNIVYCLEPYVTFSNGSDYTKYEWDLSSYNTLSNDKLRKIELLSYYGYGYGNRLGSKWYVITQYLIWETIIEGTNDTIYFTNKLNGKKVLKYTNEIAEIMEDVNKHDVVDINGNYVVSYGDDLKIGELSDYEIVSSSYNYQDGIFTNIHEDGVIYYKKVSNIYEGKIALYVSDNNQDLLKPGNIDNPINSINVKVQSGDITLDIRDDDSIYTIESDFSNTCYEISKDNKVIDKVCSGKEGLVYKTDLLAYGDYEIKQISNGIGYLKDNKVYKVTISDDNTHPKVVLTNQLLRNTIKIHKYACFNTSCGNEVGAVFIVLDSKGKEIKKITTNKEGDAEIELGYGHYKVKQESGLEGYSLADEVSSFIQNEDDVLEYTLYNLKKEEPVQEVEQVVEILPPDTGVGSKVWKFIKKMMNLFIRSTKTI